MATRPAPRHSESLRSRSARMVVLAWNYCGEPAPITAAWRIERANSLQWICHPCETCPVLLRGIITHDYRPCDVPWVKSSAVD